VTYHSASFQNVTRSAASSLSFRDERLALDVKVNSGEVKRRISCFGGQRIGPKWAEEGSMGRIVSLKGLKAAADRIAQG
jgi:hypothetical protein